MKTTIVKIKQAFTTTMCGNDVEYFGEGPICQVQPAAAVEEGGIASFPARFQLLQNYPNPFNPETTIEYTLPKSSFVKLRVFDTLGQEVRTLVNDFQQAGFKSVAWDGKNNHGQIVPSGQYIYQLTADGVTRSAKLLLLKYDASSVRVMSGYIQAALFVVVIPLILGTWKPAPAQHYQVGVPVCDTVVAGTEFGACAPNDVLLFRLGSSLVPYVTGLSFQIVITETNGRIWSSLSDAVKAGDVLPMPARVDSGVDVFFAIGSSFKFITRIVGTPTVPLENYYCETRYGRTLVVCGNTLAIYGEGQICQVQPATSVEDKDDSFLPVHFQLLQNYPNPFNPKTTLEFTLPRSSFVKLRVFDMLGQEVRTLVNDFGQAGYNSAVWDGRNNQREFVPSGVYLSCLQTNGNLFAMKKLVLLR
jgi:flagellar hook assembly protein FlgD